MGCTGARSGLAAPSVTTLVVNPGDRGTSAVVVLPNCDELVLQTVPSLEEPGALSLSASNKSIGIVLSYPSVYTLVLSNNAITSFNATSSTIVKDVDLTSNGLSTLTNINLPASLFRLTLDFNSIQSFSASNFPPNLSQLYFRKAGFKSLAPYEFPSLLTKLYLNGNQQLTSLQGFMMPSQLTHFECNDCGITEIVGMTFSKTLATFTISGPKVTSFDFRASDLSILQKASIQTSGVSVTSCLDAKSTLTSISSTIKGCMFGDTDFAIKYPPPLRPSSSSGTSTRNPLSGTSSSTTTTSSPSPSTSGTSSGGSSSNTMQLAIVGGVVLLAVIVGALIGVVLMRRRRSRKSSERVQDPDENNKATGSDTTTDPVLVSRQRATDSLSLGFLDNDVRNDPALIPYRLPQDELVIQSELARGGFGIVYKATLFRREVVVKQVSQADKPAMLRRFMDEIRLYAKLDHPKIVQFIGFAWTNLLDLRLVMEFMAGGDLHSFLRASQLKDSDEFQWFQSPGSGPGSAPRSKALLALDIAEALVYLHSFSSPIVHRDVKAKNVLLTKDHLAKLGDFGISRIRAEETMTAGMGTTAWIAPEVLQGERYTERADVYSYGILLCELDACGHPYKNTSRDGQDPEGGNGSSLTDARIAFLVSTHALKPSLSEMCPEAIQRLVMNCLHHDPAERPSAVEIHYKLRKVLETVAK